MVSPETKKILDEPVSFVYQGATYEIKGKVAVGDIVLLTDNKTYLIIESIGILFPKMEIIATPTPEQKAKALKTICATPPGQMFSPLNGPPCSI